MKIINVDINDEIIFKNVVDVDTGVITGISSGVKLPTGNYNNIILNFSFANKKLCENFNIFASFKINNGTPIVQEIEPMTIGNVTYECACIIPNEVFQDKCEVTLGVYGYRLNEDETLDKRFSLVPVRNFVIEGSYDPDATEGIVPTPTVFDIYFDKISKAEKECENLLEQTDEDCQAMIKHTTEECEAIREQTAEDVENMLRQVYESTELSGEVIETDTLLAIESNLHISGNSEQDSRSGKNILDVTATPPFKYNVTKEVIETGVRITSTINGNSQDSFYVAYVVKKLTSSDVGKTVRLKSDCVSSSTNKSRFRIGVCASDGTNRTFFASSVAGGSGETLTAVIPELIEGQEYLCAVFASTNGVCNAGDYVDYTNVVLTIDNEDTSYEPYGLKPSPEFESPIMSVKSKSDNLFDISKKKDNTSFIWATGIEINSEGSVFSDYIDINTIKEIASNYKFLIAFYDTNKTYLGNGEDLTTVGHDPAYNIKIPSNENIAYMRVVWRKLTETGNIDMTTVTDIMLNKGTVALPYQPYGYVPAEARAEGKNLVEYIYNFANTSVVDGVCSQTHTDTYTDLVWKAHAYQGNTVGESLYYQTRNGLGVKSFTFWKKSNFNRIRFGLNGAVKDTLVIMDVGHLEDGEYTFQWNVLNNTQGSISWNNIQINRGGTLQPYEPFKLTTVSLPLGDIELRSTPDGTRDTFARVDGVWNKKNNVGNTVANGQNGQTASLVASYATENYNAFTIAGITPAWSKAACKGYSDKFKVITTANDINGKDEPNLYFGNVTKAEIWVKVSKEVAPTVDDFKTWLPNNPIEIQYPLAEPTYTPITDQALISALDELEQLILHKGYNRITVTAVNGVKAYLDLEIYSTDSVTEVVATDALLDLIVPTVTQEGFVKAKIPNKENQITLNPSTGLVKVKDLEINGQKGATEKYVDDTTNSKTSEIRGDLYTSDRYNTPTYSGNALTLNLPLAKYETGKIVRITAPATLTNPTININNLGAKQINDTISVGEKYELIYNGTNWGVREKDYVTGIYTGNAEVSTSLQTQDIILGFTPKAVWVIEKNLDDDYSAKKFGLAITDNFMLPNYNFSDATPVKIIDNGFRVANFKTSANASALVFTNLKDTVYMYLAFK